MRRGRVIHTTAPSTTSKKKGPVIPRKYVGQELGLPYRPDTPSSDEEPVAPPPARSESSSPLPWEDDEQQNQFAAAYDNVETDFRWSWRIQPEKLVKFPRKELLALTGKGGKNWHQKYGAGTHIDNNGRRITITEQQWFWQFEIMAKITADKPLKLDMVDTIVMKDEHPFAWFFTNKEGRVVRRPKKEHSIHAIRKRIRDQANKYDDMKNVCVARYMDNKDRPALTLALDSPLFHELCMHSSFAPTLMYLQSYVLGRSQPCTLYRNVMMMLDGRRIFATTKIVYPYNKSGSKPELNRSHAHTFNETLNDMTLTLVRSLEAYSHLKIEYIDAKYLIDTKGKILFSHASEIYTSETEMEQADALPVIEPKVNLSTFKVKRAGNGNMVHKGCAGRYCDTDIEHSQFLENGTFKYRETVTTLPKLAGMYKIRNRSIVLAAEAEGDDSALNTTDMSRKHAAWFYMDVKVCEVCYKVYAKLDELRRLYQDDEDEVDLIHDIRADGELVARPRSTPPVALQRLEREESLGLQSGSPSPQLQKYDVNIRRAWALMDRSFPRRQDSPILEPLQDKPSMSPGSPGLEGGAGPGGEEGSPGWESKAALTFPGPKGPPRAVSTPGLDQFSGTAPSQELFSRLSVPKGGFRTKPTKTTKERGGKSHKVATKVYTEKVYHPLQQEPYKRPDYGPKKSMSRAEAEKYARRSRLTQVGNTTRPTRYGNIAFAPPPAAEALGLKPDERDVFTEVDTRVQAFLDEQEEKDNIRLRKAQAADLRKQRVQKAREEEIDARLKRPSVAVSAPTPTPPSIRRKTKDLSHLIVPSPSLTIQKVLSVYGVTDPFKPVKPKAGKAEPGSPAELGRSSLSYGTYPGRSALRPSSLAPEIDLDDDNDPLFNPLVRAPPAIPVSATPEAAKKKKKKKKKKSPRPVSPMSGGTPTRLSRSLTEKGRVQVGDDTLEVNRQASTASTGTAGTDTSRFLSVPGRGSVSGYSGGGSGRSALDYMSRSGSDSSSITFGSNTSSITELHSDADGTSSPGTGESENAEAIVERLVARVLVRVVHHAMVNYRGDVHKQQNLHVHSTPAGNLVSSSSMESSALANGNKVNSSSTRGRLLKNESTAGSTIRPQRSRKKGLRTSTSTRRSLLSTLSTKKSSKLMVKANDSVILVTTESAANLPGLPKERDGYHSESMGSISASASFNIDSAAESSHADPPKRRLKSSKKSSMRLSHSASASKSHRSARTRSHSRSHGGSSGSVSQSAQSGDAAALVSKSGAKSPASRRKNATLKRKSMKKNRTGSSMFIDLMAAESDAASESTHGLTPLSFKWHDSTLDDIEDIIEKSKKNNDPRSYGEAITFLSRMMRDHGDEGRERVKAGGARIFITQSMLQYRQIPKLQERGILCLMDLLVGDVSDLYDDIMEAVLMAMDLHPTDPVIQKSGVILLGDLAAQDAARGAIGRRDGIKLVKKVLTETSDDPVVVTYSFHVLNNMAASNTARALMVLGDNFPEVLDKIVETHIANSVVCEHAAVMMLLWAHSDDPAVKAIVAESRAFECLTTWLFEEHGEQRADSLISHYCSLVRALSAQHDMKGLLVEKGTMRTLVSLLGYSVHRDSLLSFVLLAMRSLWHDPNKRNTFADHKKLAIMNGAAGDILAILPITIQSLPLQRLCMATMAEFAAFPVVQNSIETKHVDIIANSVMSHSKDNVLLKFGFQALSHIVQAAVKNDKSNKARKQFMENPVLKLAMQSMMAEEPIAPLCEPALKIYTHLASGDADTQFEIAEAGGINAVVNSMLKLPRHPGIQEVGSSLLRWLGMQDANRRLMASKGVLEVLYEALAGHVYDSHVQKSALMALRVIVQYQSIRVASAKFDIIGEITMTINRNIAEPVIIRVAVALLADLTTTKDQQAIFMERDALDSVLHVLKNLTSDAISVQQCFTVLTNMLESKLMKDVGQGLSEKKSMPIIMTAAEQNMSTASIIFKATTIIRICTDQDLDFFLLEPACEAGAVRVLVDALRNHSGDAYVVEAVLTSLRKLIMPSTVNQFDPEGLVGMIIPIVKKATKSKKAKKGIKPPTALAPAVFSAILASGVRSDEPYLTPLVPILTKIMGLFQDDQDIQEQCIETLDGLVKTSQEAQKFLVNNDGMSVLMTAMRYHNHSAAVVQHTAATVYSVYDNKTLRSNVLVDLVVNLLVAGLKMHGSRASVQAAGISLLAAFVENAGQAIGQQIKRAGGLEVIQRAMQVHAKKNPAIKSNALTILGRIG